MDERGGPSGGPLSHSPRAETPHDLKTLGRDVLLASRAPRKTTESGVFSASRRQPNMSPLERATHNGTTAVRGPDGAGGAVNGGEESRASSPAPPAQDRERKEKRSGAGLAAALSPSPRRPHCPSPLVRNIRLLAFGCQLGTKFRCSFRKKRPRTPGRTEAGCQDGGRGRLSR
jgi:hypothetical protein